MKAIQITGFGSTEHMKYVDVDVPTITSKQVLIAVKSTSVNFGDIKARYGNKGQKTLPFIPGLEAAGIIERVGDEVTTLFVGQRVLAFPHEGSYAEYVAADENLTFVLPDLVEFDVAGACGIASFLSYKLLVDTAKIQAGDNVLIHSASGGVGTTAIQIARALGATTIIGAVGHEDKFPVVIEAGANHVVNYSDETFPDKVMELTHGKGVHIVLDSVGGNITAQSMQCLCKYGRLVVFGNSSGTYAQLSTDQLHVSCRSVLGFSFATTRKEQPESIQDIAREVFRLLESGQLNIKVSKKMHLADAAVAHQLIENRQSTGKIVLYTMEI
jgi:NADPH2:quinone reductase